VDCNPDHYKTVFENDRVRVLEYTDETRRQSPGSQLAEEDVCPRWRRLGGCRRRAGAGGRCSACIWRCPGGRAAWSLGFPCCNRVRWRFTVFLVGERTTR